MNRGTRRHTASCAADHRCNLAEHRSAEIVVHLPGHGRAVLTRVRDDQGREYGEIRARVTLDPDDDAARHQLRTALNALRDLLAHAARPTLRYNRRRAA